MNDTFVCSCESLGMFGDRGKALDDDTFTDFLLCIGWCKKYYSINFDIYVEAVQTEALMTVIYAKVYLSITGLWTKDMWESYL